MRNIDDWTDLTARINACHTCAIQNVPDVCVPNGNKIYPGSLYHTAIIVRLLFIGIAPPRRGAYFWNDAHPDRLRVALLRVLKIATSDKTRLNSALSFREAGFSLVPAVQCPSERNGQEHPPSPVARRNCLTYLRQTIELLQPERILALGKVPGESIAQIFGFTLPPTLKECRERVWWVKSQEHKIPCSVTYFPGNNRHRQMPSIVAAVGQLLALSPCDRR